MRKSTKNRKGKPGRKRTRTKEVFQGNNEAGKVGRGLKKGIWDVKIVWFFDSGNLENDLARSDWRGRHGGPMRTNARIHGTHQYPGFGSEGKQFEESSI